MTVTLEFIAEQLTRVIDEQRAQRLELRRLNDNQMTIAREQRSIRDQIGSLRDELELMIKTEIGGLFTHLETRLEQRIDAIIADRSR
jgi:hypothetical protein